MSEEPRAATRVAVRRELDRPPEVVFRALSEPDLYARWMGPEGSTATVERMDVRVGGGFAVTIELPDGSAVEISGEYREVEAPRRLVHTWRLGDDEGGSVVAFELAAIERGTRLELVHEGLVDPQMRDRNEAGWRHQLDRMERALAELD